MNNWRVWGTRPHKSTVESYPVRPAQCNSSRKSDIIKIFLIAICRTGNSMCAFWAKLSRRQKTNGSDGTICFVFSVKVIQALFVCLQSVGQKMKTRARETQMRTDVERRRKRAHTPTLGLEYDEWCLGSGGYTSLGRRTNFVPSSALCLSFLVSDEPAETVGNNVSVNRGGITHPWLGQTLSCSSYCIVCRPHGSLKVSRSAQRWWITYKDWKSSRVSCFLLCPTVCLLLDTVWSPLSADLLQAMLQIQPACTGNVWLISHIEDYVDH